MTLAAGMGRSLVLVLAVALLVGHTTVTAQLFGRRRPAVSETSVRKHMTMLASDAMNGRASGSRDEWLAATYVASEVAQWGLEPLGDAGTFIQTIETPPRPARRGGGGSPSAAGAPTPAAETGPGRTWNVVARLTGRDRPAEVIVIGAHLDHVGARGTGPDTIFNGADDNASGVTAVLELARVFALGPRPRRTIVFAWFGSEESGGQGSRHFVERPPVPLTSIVANLQFEMIGRPDPAVPNATLWLTGFERSTLGQALASHGARLVADPHPDQKFFERSDNIRFAREGVVAHTVSSYGLHREYHTPADDLSRIDFPHMVGAIKSLVGPLAWLAGSTFVPSWIPGQRPERR
jgi:hypothetical protein